MGLTAELQEARVAVARAKSDELEYRNRLNSTVDASNPTTGNKLRELEQAVADAEANLVTVERDILDRARTIVEKHDPAYAAQVSNANLVSEVEKHALIGAADRLTGN